MFFEGKSGTGRGEVMTREELIDKLASWIDTRVIAEAVVEGLEERIQDTSPEGELVKLGDCQALWLSMLDNLPSEIKKTARYIMK